MPLLFAWRASSALALRGLFREPVNATERG